MDRTEYSKEYYQKNKDKIKAYSKKWKESNPERCSQWKEENKDRILTSKRKWREVNNERYLESQRNWRSANKERCKDGELKRCYGITLEEYSILLETQFGVCVICGTPDPKGKSLCVDHDHSTGAIRGLLCDKCNRGLGYFNDDKELLLKAAEYLTEHNKKDVK